MQLLHVVERISHVQPPPRCFPSHRHPKPKRRLLLKQRLKPMQWPLLKQRLKPMQRLLLKQRLLLMPRLLLKPRLLPKRSLMYQYPFQAVAQLLMKLFPLRSSKTSAVYPDCVPKFRP